MNITELIARLEALRAEHGDLPFCPYNDLESDDIKFYSPTDRYAQGYFAIAIYMD